MTVCFFTSIMRTISTGGDIWTVTVMRYGGDVLMQKSDSSLSLLMGEVTKALVEDIR